MRYAISMLGLLACADGGGTKDTGTIPSDGGTDTGGTTTTTTTTDTVECNAKNEDCGPGSCGGEGPTMLPGSSCLDCHTNGNMSGETSPNKLWTIAGTAFVDRDGTAPLDGATIRITGDDAKVIELTTNKVGNFYTLEKVAFPFSAEIEANGKTLAMSAHQEDGSCNSCHACDGSAGAKLYGPE